MRRAILSFCFLVFFSMSLINDETSDCIPVYYVPTIPEIDGEDGYEIPRTFRLLSS